MHPRPGIASFIALRKQLYNWKQGETRSTSFSLFFFFFFFVTKKNSLEVKVIAIEEWTIYIYIWLILWIMNNNLFTLGAEMNHFIYSYPRSRILDFFTSAKKFFLQSFVLIFFSLSKFHREFHSFRPIFDQTPEL